MKNGSRLCSSELFMIAKIPQIPYHRVLNIKFGFNDTATTSYSP